MFNLRGKQGPAPLGGRRTCISAATIRIAKTCNTSLIPTLMNSITRTGFSIITSIILINALTPMHR